VLVEEACGTALFGILAEGLADRFEPALCDTYARLFAQAVAHVTPGVEPAILVDHYQRVRRPRPVSRPPRRIVVLSRVTLGADVNITSVLMAAAKRRFPRAEIFFAGPHKNFELFAADRRLRHAPLSYAKGGLRERLAVWGELKALVEADDCLVVDPDSRLTQLGLLPVGSEDRYHLFESRAYGAESDHALSALAAAWAAETFGVAGAKPYVALSRTPRHAPYCAVSLGVGENSGKRLADPFEENLLAAADLHERGIGLCIDQGAGGEEAARAARAVERSGVKATLWEGSFAGFAGIIAGSRLYIGYDSAGQHVAAACGVPLISIFSGYCVSRFFHRWRPMGERCEVIRVEGHDVSSVLDQVRAAIGRLV